MYKTGDVVLMGPEKWQRERRPSSRFSWPNEVVEIARVDKAESGLCYWVKRDGVEDTGQHYVHESQILGYNFEYGQEIEVSDTFGEFHDDWKFDSYNIRPGMVRVWTGNASNTVSFKYARPIQEPEFKIGDTVEGSDDEARWYRGQLAKIIKSSPFPYTIRHRSGARKGTQPYRHFRKPVDKPKQPETPAIGVKSIIGGANRKGEVMAFVALRKDGTLHTVVWDSHTRCHKWHEIKPPQPI